MPTCDAAAAWCSVCVCVCDVCVCDCVWCVCVCVCVTVCVCDCVWCVCVCVCDCVCVCVCVRERERERVCVCVCGVSVWTRDVWCEAGMAFVYADTFLTVQLNAATDGLANPPFENVPLFERFCCIQTIDRSKRTKVANSHKDEHRSSAHAHSPRK